MDIYISRQRGTDIYMFSTCDPNARHHKDVGTCIDGSSIHCFINLQFRSLINHRIVAPWIRGSVESLIDLSVRQFICLFSEHSIIHSSTHLLLHSSDQSLLRSLTFLSFIRLFIHPIRNQCMCKCIHVYIYIYT